MPTEPDERVVHPRWLAWVAENLAAGARPDVLVDALIGEGVPARPARAAVDEIAASPALGQARRLARRVSALEQIVRLRRELRATAAGIVRRSLPSPAGLIAEHWAPGIPAVFTDLVCRWPAFGRWSPRDLAARFGDVVVQACVGRTTARQPDADWEPLCRELTVRELVRRIDAPGAGNDVYAIAKNALLRRAGLSPLLDEIAGPPEYFGPTMDPARVSLWLGAAGTHTPLHHDGDNAMFCQVVGRKRVRLAPPESIALLDRSCGVYCTWDPATGTEPELAAGPESLQELVLAPGEALFIPAGWWHQVDALDPSMSVSVLQFAWPNDFSWYKPGTALRGRG